MYKYRVSLSLAATNKSIKWFVCCSSRACAIFSTLPLPAHTLSPSPWHNISVPYSLQTFSASHCHHPRAMFLLTDSCVCQTQSSDPTFSARVSQDPGSALVHGSSHSRLCIYIFFISLLLYGTLTSFKSNHCRAVLAAIYQLERQFVLVYSDIDQVLLGSAPVDRTIRAHEQVRA
jgi:hypothetical protein